MGLIGFHCVGHATHTHKDSASTRILPQRLAWLDIAALQRLALALVNAANTTHCQKTSTAGVSRDFEAMIVNVDVHALLPPLRVLAFEAPCECVPVCNVIGCQDGLLAQLPEVDAHVVQYL